VIKIKVEPIIDEETFSQAQKILQENSPEAVNPAIGSSCTLLTGILRCGRCGKSMTLETAKGGKYRYYNCRGYTREASCKGQRVPICILDKEVLEHLSSKFFSMERLKLIASQWLKEVNKDEYKDERKKIISAIKNEKKKLENIYRAIEDGIITKGNIDERIEQIKANIRFLEERLNRIENIRRLPTFRFLSTPFLQKLQERLKEAFHQDPLISKKYLKLFIDKIIIDEENVTILARKDILSRVISFTKSENSEEVLTAGVEWLRKSNSMRNFGHEFDIRTFQAERGKYRIEIIN